MNPKSRVSRAVAASNRRRTKHGFARDGKRHPVYNIWLAMKDRCYNPNNRFYHRYGGRGISVCALWRRDYSAFIAYMGKRPSPKHSLDRIDNNKGYYPGNVRWATRHQQSHNTSANVFIRFRGKTLSLHEWAEELNIPYGMILQRRHRGLPVHKILAPRTTRVRSSKVRFGGKAMSLREWAAHSGVKYATLWRRLQDGRPLFRKNEWPKE